MKGKSQFRVGGELLVIALLLGVCSCGKMTDGKTPEGTWGCTTVWSCEKDGVSVSCAAEQQFSCVQNALSASGVVSIGDAQWSEKKEGSCYASGQELYGAWTSIVTVAKNDAARQFEQERLGGESLASKATGGEPQPYRVRVISRTETQLKGIGDNGRAVACTRL